MARKPDGMAQGRAPLIVPSDLAAAAGLLTRLPVPVDPEKATARGARAAWAYPLVGAGIGAVTAAGLPAGAATAIALAVTVMVTGALHEDGLADTADGVWGGWSPARRLEIMKDSRVGVYGVLALCLSLLLRWTALSALAAAGAWGAVIAVAALSRAAMVGVWAALPSARATGLAAGSGRPGRATLALALLAGLPWLGLVPLGAAAVCLAAAAVAAASLARLAARRLGGQTGDVLGATQQATEIAGLLALAAVTA